jgi:hypothetical protein
LLSPALFNHFVSDCPSDGDIQDSYADDFDLMESDSDLSVLDRKLQASVDSVVEWAKQKKHTIALAKSQVTLYMPWNRQMHVRPYNSIDGIPVPLNKNIKYTPASKLPALKQQAPNARTS